MVKYLYDRDLKAWNLPGFLGECGVLGEEK